MTDRPLTEQEVQEAYGLPMETAVALAWELNDLQQRLAEAERRYAELVKDTKQAVDDAGWAEELAEAKLAQAERERDEALGRESHHATKRKQAESQLARARAALERIANPKDMLDYCGSVGFASKALEAMDKGDT